MIGGWPTPLGIGEVIELRDKLGDRELITVPALVLREATLQEYIDQQIERGNIDYERTQSWSILNTAKYFYKVRVD